MIYTTLVKFINLFINKKYKLELNLKSIPYNLCRILHLDKAYFFFWEEEEEVDIVEGADVVSGENFHEAARK